MPLDSLNPLIAAFSAIVSACNLIPNVVLKISVRYSRATASPEEKETGTLNSLSSLPPSLELRPGRPKLKKMLDSTIKCASALKAPSGVAVCVCGPIELVAEVREIVRDVNGPSRTAVGGVELHEEYVVKNSVVSDSTDLCCLNQGVRVVIMPYATSAIETNAGRIRLIGFDDVKKCSIACNSNVIAKRTAIYWQANGGTLNVPSIIQIVTVTSFAWLGTPYTFHQDDRSGLRSRLLDCIVSSSFRSRNAKSGRVSFSPDFHFGRRPQLALLLTPDRSPCFSFIVLQDSKRTTYMITKCTFGTLIYIHGVIGMKKLKKY